MASKASRQRREEMKQLFNEVCQIARQGASPIMKTALDAYQARFEELTERKKKEPEGEGS